MAFKENLRSRTIQAAGDLSSSQYRAVVIDGTGRAALVSTLGGAIDGILQNAPAAAGRACEVADDGTTQWVAGGTIAAGADVTVDASGRCVTAATGQQVHGKALYAGVIGAIIPVKLGSRRPNAP
jgi:hypothetical protein